jgi:hypothetical protein
LLSICIVVGFGTNKSENACISCMSAFLHVHMQIHIQRVRKICATYLQSCMQTSLCACACWYASMYIRANTLVHFALKCNKTNYACLPRTGTCATSSSLLRASYCMRWSKALHMIIRYKIERAQVKKSKRKNQAYKSMQI